jgi:glycosyltransferase involved in cell wall biosynthesis
MKGYYFINTDVTNTRAHTIQILNTLSATATHVPIELVAPRYHQNIDIEGLKGRHDLTTLPRINLIYNFGFKSPGSVSFLLFNLSSFFFLLARIGEVSFIYLRSTYFLPMALFARLAGIPCFYETHRIPLTPGEKWRDDLMSRLSSGFVLISDHVRKYYEQYGKTALVVHDAVHLERFTTSVDKEKIRNELGLAPTDKICTYTGTVSRLKGVDYLIEAAKLLPETIFLLIGPVRDEFDISLWPKNVRALGYKEQKDLPGFLKISDVLVIPHPDSEYSQSPMKLFEYMASGVPVVSTRLESLIEILNAENAVLVEPNNAESLADGIKLTLGDKNKSDTISKRAFEDVQEYTWEKRGQKIAEFINKLV